MIHKDKIKDFLVSFLLLVIIYLLVRDLTLAVLTTILFGLTKELFDQVKKKNTAKESLADLGVNILGIVLGITLVLLVSSHWR